ncbi:MAG: hypothetical protein ACLFM1_11585 [Bacteroidales bacterium]
MKNNKNSKNQFTLIVIEYLWLAMAAFTLFAGIKKLNQGEYAQWYAWVFFVLAILCVVMFFVRRHARRQNKPKR